MMIFLYLFIFVTFMFAVDSKEVTPTSKEITVTLNNEIELKWKISSDIRITTINVYINTEAHENLIISGLSIGMFVPTVGKTRYGDRISAKLNSNEVVIKIQKAQLNETNSVFIFNILEVKDSKATYFRSKISLTVQGGPIFCADQIPATRSYNENTSPSITVTVCGIPKPTVTWQLDSNSLSGGVSSNSTSQPHGYDYSITLPNLTPSMCGKQLMLQADGHSGKITATSTLDIEFKPDKVNNLKLERSGNCSTIKWTPLNTGSCRVTYAIDVLSNNNTVIYRRKNIINTSVIICTLSKSSYVNVWAVNGQKNGGVTTAYETRIIRNKEDAAVLEDVAIYCGGVLFIIIVVMVTIFITRCLCKKGKKISENSS